MMGRRRWRNGSAAPASLSGNVVFYFWRPPREARAIGEQRERGRREAGETTMFTKGCKTKRKGKAPTVVRWYAQALMRFNLQGKGDSKYQLFGDYCHFLQSTRTRPIDRGRAQERAEKINNCHSTSILDAPTFWFKGCRLSAWPDHQRERGSPSCFGLPKEERRKLRDGGGE